MTLRYLKRLPYESAVSCLEKNEVEGVAYRASDNVWESKIENIQVKRVIPYKTLLKNIDGGYIKLVRFHFYHSWNHERSQTERR